jgi:hypothetical protein
MPETGPQAPREECAECGAPMERVPLLAGHGMQCTRCTNWHPCD